MPRQFLTHYVTLKIGITMTEVLHHLKLSVQYHYDVAKRYHIAMSLQCQYVVGLHRDENPTKKRCRHNISCQLGKKARCTCTFLNHFGEANKELLCALFL